MVSYFTIANFRFFLLKSSVVLLRFLSLSAASKARTYCDIGIYEKLSIASLVLEPVARFRSLEARTLRDCEGSVAWELRMMQGGINNVSREILRASWNRSSYASFGLERSWFETPDMSAPHVLIAMDDATVGRLWDFSTTSVCEFEKRILPFTESLPRRLTLCLSKDEKERKEFIETSLLDERVFELLKAGSEAWSRALVKTSVFQRADVQQVCAILKEVGGKCTARLQCDTCPIYKFSIRRHPSDDFPWVPE